MNDEQTRLIPIDERLNEKIMVFYEKSVDAFVNQDYKSCYNYMRSIFYAIYPYDFNMKTELKDITEQINTYLYSLGGKPVNKYHQIKIYEKQQTFSELVEQYFEIIPQALKSLGKWMRVLKNVDDFDEQMSEETFGTDVTLLIKKKEELINLKTKEIIDHLTPNQIHDVHSRYLIKNALTKK